MPKKGMQEAKNDFKRIYDASTQEEARRLKEAFIDKYEDNPKLEKAIETLEEGFEDTIQYLSEPVERHKFIRTTHSLERLNQEVRRRERVIRIFPNNQSAFRLIGSILMDYEKNEQKKRVLFKWPDLLKTNAKISFAWKGYPFQANEIQTYNLG